MNFHLWLSSALNDCVVKQHLVILDLSLCECMFVWVGVSVPLPGMPKKYPLRNFANVLGTIKRCDIITYLLITHSNIRLLGKFHYIVYRIDFLSRQLRCCLNYSMQCKPYKCEHYRE